MPTSSLSTLKLKTVQGPLALALSVLAFASPTRADDWTVVELDPGTGESWAWGTTATQQVGYVTCAGNPCSAQHASLWSGSAASWVDLHPTGATWSQVLGMSSLE